MWVRVTSSRPDVSAGAESAETCATPTEPIRAEPGSGTRTVSVRPSVCRLMRTTPTPYVELRVASTFTSGSSDVAGTATGWSARGEERHRVVARHELVVRAEDGGGGREQSRRPILNEDVAEVHDQPLLHRDAHEVGRQERIQHRAGIEQRPELGDRRRMCGERAQPLDGVAQLVGETHAIVLHR